MLITWMCCFLFFLVPLNAITGTKNNTSCVGVSSCKGHNLNCSESEYVYVTGGSYGYKVNCSTPITAINCQQGEITRCCETGRSDCLKPINKSALRKLCLKNSTCSFPGKTSPENTSCNNIHKNSYSKIEYSCITKGTTSTETTTASTDGGDNTGGIIGAVVATIVVVAIILVVVIIIMKRKKKQSAQENPLNERKGSTVPIINNIAGERETTGYSEVDLGDMSTSQTKSPSSNTDIPNQVTEPTTYAEYNHLGDNNSVKTKPSNANYNHIQINKSGEDNYQHFQNPGKPKPQTNAEYNHIGAVDKMLDEGDYNSLGGIQRDVPNSDYDLSNYSHIGEVQRDVANNVPDLGGAGIQDGQQGPSNVRRNDYAQVNKKRK